MYRLILISCLFWLQSALAIDSDELLQPEQAFQLSTDVLSNDKIKLSWQIADGYYLYKDKFYITALTSGITLQPAFPTAEIKEDQFFGKTEIYHDHLDVELLITQHPSQLNKIELNISYQGCAEVGVCYLPIQKQLSINLNTNK
ncbi:Thiol:disulfide interchange protein DsbD [Patescibacteria group bacterium]|nr:Thiol:disulfide interchange protein DsbD [Patescibacteria group bacterium]